MMLKQRRFHGRIAMSLVMVFLFSLAGTVFAAASPLPTANDYCSYVALGDSLAAGQSPFGVENGYGYTNMIQNELAKAGAAGGFHNFGKSGLTAGQLLDWMTPDSPDYRPVMAAALEKADLVTLDIGANDLLPHIWALAQNQETLEQVSTALQGTLGDVAAILAGIHGLNPSAKVYVMGYYDALANILNAYPDVHEGFLTLLGSFNTGLEAITVSNGYEYISTMGFVTPEELPGDIHPNREGYAAIAGLFWVAMESELPPK